MLRIRYAKARGIYNISSLQNISNLSLDKYIDFLKKNIDKKTAKEDKISSFAVFY